MTLFKWQFALDLKTIVDTKCHHLGHRLFWNVGCCRRSTCWINNWAESCSGLWIMTIFVDRVEVDRILWLNQLKNISGRTKISSGIHHSVNLFICHSIFVQINISGGNLTSKAKMTKSSKKFTTPAPPTTPSYEDNGKDRFVIFWKNWIIV